MTQLTEEFSSVIAEHGFYVVHFARQHHLPCPRCTGQEASQNCPICLGLQFRPLIRPTLVRNSAPMRPEYRSLQDAPVGTIIDSEEIFYFLPAAKPREGDVLALVTWSVQRERVEDEGQVVAVNRFYVLKDVTPAYGEAGRLVHYRAGSRTTTVNIDILQAALFARPIL